jgi:hypothetical protein
MRTAAVLIIGATPGLALGYVLLSAYLLSRIVPLPIMQLPRASRAESKAVSKAA